MIELSCLRQFYYFSKRHRRYFKIAVILYLYSLISWKKAKLLRLGFCSLQIIDDILDGDRASQENPQQLVQELKKTVLENVPDPHLLIHRNQDLFLITRAFLNNLQQLPTYHEAIQDFVDLIDLMLMDYERRKFSILLSKEDLKFHHRATFSLSLNLTFIALKSQLRSKDLVEILDLLGWCSTLRDLEEDLAKGLINIPKEDLPDLHPYSQQITQLLSHPQILLWKNRYHAEMKEILPLCETKLARLKRQKGSIVFKIFLNSIKDFHALFSTQEN